MRALIAGFIFLMSLNVAAQSERSVDKVRLPQCEKLSDLKQALSKVERRKGFSEDDDYKFLQGFGKRCGRYKIRSRSYYKFHGYHATGDNIFTIYQVSGGKGYEGGKVVGFVANSVFSKDYWRVSKGKECVLTAPGGGCLLPKRCRVATGSSDSSYYQKLRLDEFAVPPYCYSVGEES